MSHQISASRVLIDKNKERCGKGCREATYISILCNRIFETMMQHTRRRPGVVCIQRRFEAMYADKTLTKSQISRTLNPKRAPHQAAIDVLETLLLYSMQSAIEPEASRMRSCSGKVPSWGLSISREGKYNSEEYHWVLTMVLIPVSYAIFPICNFLSV